MIYGLLRFVASETAQVYGIQMARPTFSATEKSDGTGDKITKNDNLKWFGHLGDAYGLFSGMVFDPAKGDGMAQIIGGVGTDPDINALGSYWAFYRWEEQILSAAYQRVSGLP